MREDKVYALKFPSMSFPTYMTLSEDLELFFEKLISLKDTDNLQLLIENFRHRKPITELFKYVDTDDIIYKGRVCLSEKFYFVYQLLYRTEILY